MAVFTFRKAGAVPAVDTGTVTFLSALAATTRALRLVEASASGLGTATAANEFQIAPGTAGTGALTNIAPFPINPLSTAAAGFTAGTTYATAIPTVNSQAGIAFGVNSNGGTYRWLAKTNFELFASQASANYASLNWKVIATGEAGNIAGHAIFVEL
jgi:hypothetical protein